MKDTYWSSTVCPRTCTRLWSYSGEINRPELRSGNWTTYADFLLGWPPLPPHYPSFMDTPASCPSAWSSRMLHSINYFHSFLKGGYARSLLSMRIVRPGFWSVNTATFPLLFSFLGTLIAISVLWQRLLLSGLFEVSYHRASRNTQPLLPQHSAMC